MCSERLLSLSFLIFHQEYQHTAFLFVLFDLNWNTVFHLTVSKCFTFVTSILSGVRERSAMAPQISCYGRKWLIYFLCIGILGWNTAFNKARANYSLPEHQSAQESAQLTVSPGRRKHFDFSTPGLLRGYSWVSPSLVQTKCVYGSSNLVHVHITCQNQEIPGREHTEFSVAMATALTSSKTSCQYFGLLFMSAVE